MARPNKSGETISMYERGMSIEEIAAELGLKPKTIYNRLERAGVLLKSGRQIRREKSEENRRLAVEMYPTHGVMEISRILGITYGTVCRYITEAGIPKRTKQEERRINREYLYGSEEATLGLCRECGEKAVLNSDGLCTFCSSPTEKDPISEHDAWFELEDGWMERNLVINHEFRRGDKIMVINA